MLACLQCRHCNASWPVFPAPNSPGRRAAAQKAVFTTRQAAVACRPASHLPGVASLGEMLVSPARSLPELGRGRQADYERAFSPWQRTRLPFAKRGDSTGTGSCLLCSLKEQGNQLPSSYAWRCSYSRSQGESRALVAAPGAQKRPIQRSPPPAGDQPGQSPPAPIPSIAHSLLPDVSPLLPSLQATGDPNTTYTHTTAVLRKRLRLPCGGPRRSPLGCCGKGVGAVQVLSPSPWRTGATRNESVTHRNGEGRAGQGFGGNAALARGQSLLRSV